MVDGGCDFEASTNQMAGSTVPEEPVKMKSETGLITLSDHLKSLSFGFMSIFIAAGQSAIDCSLVSVFVTILGS